MRVWLRQIACCGVTAIVAGVLMAGCIERNETVVGVSNDTAVGLSQFNNLTACHNGSGNIAVINNSNCGGCDQARATATGDWSECINTTAHSLGDNSTLRFLRDSTYRVSATLRTGGCSGWSNGCLQPHQHNDVRWEATGSGAARPIIKFVSIPPGEGEFGQFHTHVKVTGHNVSLVKLDFWGTSYNQRGAPLSEHHGINAGNMGLDIGLSGPISPAGLLLDSVQVNGFPSEGLLWSGTNLTVRNSQFRYNSKTALALFHDGSVPTSGVVVSGSDISDNGGDGIDMTSSYALIEHDTIRRNGWAIRLYPSVGWGPGERMGMILNPAGNSLGGSMMDSVTVRNNIIAGNERSGIILISDQYDSFNRIRIDDNVITGHAAGYDSNSLGSGMGVWFGKKYVGTTPVANVYVTNSYLRGNCGQNNSPDWNVPSSSFPNVTVQNNTCPAAVSVWITGPQYIARYQSAQYTANTADGTAPFSYQWRSRDYMPNSGGWTGWTPWYSYNGNPANNFTYASVNSCGITRKELEAKVTDLTSQTATNKYTIYVSNPC